jgi:hypothetical protein
MEQRISQAQYFYRTSVIFIGLLANYIVVLVTTFSPHLRNPRHIFWAAISVMEFLFLLNTALELITVQSRDYSICRLLIIFYLADDSALMLCHFLATVDRYLSIARYEWYKAIVTNRAVVLLITVALALSFFVITSPFWTGYKSIYTCTCLHRQFDSRAFGQCLEFVALFYNSKSSTRPRRSFEITSRNTIVRYPSASNSFSPFRRLIVEIPLNLESIRFYLLFWYSD